MSIWAIFKNLGTIIALFNSLKAVVEQVIATKKAPGLKDLLVPLDNLEALLKSGAIDIKGVDEMEVAAAVHKIREQLSGPLS